MKNLPYSMEAEKEVLGSMMVSKDALLNSVVRLSEEDFYVPDHKLVFNAIKSVYDKGVEVDVVSVVEQFTLNNSFNQLSDKEIIYDLTENVVSPSNIEEHIRILQDKSVLRKLVDMATDICKKWEKDGVDNIGDYVANVESDLLSITRSRNVGEFKTSKEIVDVFSEKLFSMNKSNGDVTGVTSGFKDIDKITHGFQKGDLVILAARPSMGKTALALNFLVNAALKQNTTVAMFSVEMPSELLIQRMICSLSGINGDKVKVGDFNEKEFVKYGVATDKLKEAKIFIDDTSGISLGDLMVKARKLKSMHDDLSLIVIDYLQLVRGSERARKEGVQQEVSEISRSLKQMARELKVPVIALSQLSRDSEKRDNKRPMLSDLRGSGSIEQDADIVMFIYREDYYANNKSPKEREQEKKENNSMSGIAEVAIAKNRNGATATVQLVFLKEYGLFSNYSRMEE